MNEYAFGDSALARERLGIVAGTFAVPTRSLLRDLPAGDRRYVLDMGCGPGYTTALLLDAFPHSFVTGIDSSPAMIDDARVRVPDASFAVGDVTAPVVLPAHVVYARLLLGHLADQASGLANWLPRYGPVGWSCAKNPCGTEARTHASPAMRRR